MSIRGFVDNIEAGYVRGWALDSDHPELPVSVSVAIDDGVIGTVVADLLREDVAEAFGTSGLHGFRVWIPLALRDNQLHKVSAWCGEPSQGLQTHEALLQVPAPADLQVREFDSLHISSQVTGVENGHVEGWAWATELPSMRLKLELEIDGRVVGHDTAARFSERLSEEGVADPYHGFRIELPFSQGAIVRIRVARTDHTVFLRRLEEGRVGRANPRSASEGAPPRHASERSRDADPAALSAVRKAKEIASSGEIKLISLDVWDTVLRRKCAPDEIKLQSSRYLLLVAHDLLKPAFRDVRSLFRARRFAENASAHGDDFEYRLEDGLLRWLDVVLVAGLPIRRIHQLTEALEGHELSAEIASTYPDKAVLDGCADIDVPLIFMSDFYASSEFIFRVLRSHGIDQRFVRGYSSSDSYQTKRKAKLFERVMGDFGIQPDQILHIGDNEVADVFVPHHLGVRTIHFHHDTKYAVQRRMGAVLAEHLEGETLGHDLEIGRLTQISGEDGVHVR